MRRRRADMSWERALDKVFKELKPQLDFLREYDLKAKSTRPSSASLTGPVDDE